MKIILSLLLALFISNSHAQAPLTGPIQKALVSKTDSIIRLQANMRLDHRLFGYEKADTSSRKMFLLSIFTNEVKGNPFQCPYGAFYDTNGMTGKQLKFISRAGKFIKVALLANDNPVPGNYFYFETKWLRFTP